VPQGFKYSDKLYIHALKFYFTYKLHYDIVNTTHKQRSQIFKEKKASKKSNKQKSYLIIYQ